MYVYVYIHHPTNPLTSCFFLNLFIFTCLWNVPRSYNAKCDRPRGWRQCPLQSVAFPKNKALRSSPPLTRLASCQKRCGFLSFFAGIFQINTRIYIVCICNIYFWYVYDLYKMIIDTTHELCHIVCRWSFSRPLQHVGSSADSFQLTAWGSGTFLSLAARTLEKLIQPHVSGCSKDRIYIHAYPSAKDCFCGWQPCLQFIKIALQQLQSCLAVFCGRANQHLIEWWTQAP